MELYLKKIKQAELLFKKISKNIKKENPYKLQNLVLKFEKILGDPLLTEAPHESGLKWSGALKEELEKEKKILKDQIGLELNGKLEEKGMKLEGNFPLLHSGNFFLDFDFFGGIVTGYWGPRIEPAFKCRIKAVEIFDHIEEMKKNLDSSPENEQSFMQRLFEAYENWLKRSGQVSGTFAPITEILLEMSLISQPASFRADPVRRNFRDYSRIQFSSDLSKLRNPVFNDYRMKLVVATRDSTKKKVQNLWIPVLGGGEGGTHYSHILFKRN